jgi:hypothetical protein
MKTKPTTYRCLAVDVSNDSPRFWWTVRAWNEDGRSRPVASGKCNTVRHLKKVAATHKAKMP